MDEILKIILDTKVISIEINSFTLIILLITTILLIFLNKAKSNKQIPILNLVEMEVNIGPTKTKFNVIRNAENLYIANRIYIELITRKAALEIDPEYDVIYEVYDSWYKLFNIIRDEIKNVPGKYLENNYEKSNELIKLTIKILNDGIRPHLTKYQAEFRKWFKQQQEERKNESPQQIQKTYPKFNELIEDMKNVNKTLYSYAKELEKFIYSSTDITS